MIRFLFFITISLSALIFAADSWKGKEYAKNSESQKDSAQDFLFHIKLRGDESILDVGCGDGKITAGFARQLTKGKVVGVDISPSMIQFASSTFQDLSNLHFQVMDAAKLDFTEQFDLITSFTVLQWVLDQKQALLGFKRALKRGGRILIQMPTGLPFAMQQALDTILSQEKWKAHFVSFSPPWRFYQEKEYLSLLQEVQLQPIRLDVVTKNEKFPSREDFQGFIRQWFPYLRPLPSELKDVFLTELIDTYLELLPLDEEGRVLFTIDRLEVEATK